MEAGRMGLVHKHEVKHRKFVCVMNDLVKSQHELMDGSMKLHKDETAFRYEKNASILRNAIIRQRVLQKCLKRYREANEQSNPPTKYGIYGGVPLEYMSKDIDAYIEQMHPQIRRMRKVQQLLQQSLDTGAILTPSKIMEKIEDFFSGNYRGADKLYRHVDQLEQEPDKRRRDRVGLKGRAMILPPVSTSQDSSRISKPVIEPQKRKITIEPVMRVNILKVSHSYKSDAKKSERPFKYESHTGNKSGGASNKGIQIVQYNDTRFTQDAIDLKHPRSSNLENVAEDEEEDESKLRGSLILPPLRMTKSLVQR